MSGWSAIIRTDYEVGQVVEYLRMALQGGPQTITIKAHRKKRSLAQNSLMWLWYDEIKKHIFDSQGDMYTSEDIHEWFKQLFLPKRAIEFKAKILEVQIGTKELNTIQMMEYLEKLDYYCADKLNLMLSKPEDLWREAQGR